MPNQVLDRMTTPQLREAVTQKTNRLAELWRKAGPDIDVHKIEELEEGDTQARLDQLKQMEDELNEHKAQLDVRLQIDKDADKRRMRIEHQAFQLHTSEGPPPQRCGRNVSATCL